VAVVAEQAFVRYRDDRMLEKALGDRAIDVGVGGSACEFAGFAISGRLAREECGSIDWFVADAARNALGANRADEPVAREPERGFVNEKNKCVDDLARDARIARDGGEPLDGAESFTQADGGAALVLDLLGQARQLREQNSALPFRHPVVRAHQRAFEVVARSAPSAIDERLASLLEVGVVGRDHSAFAGGHRLGGLKTEAAERAMSTDAALAESSTRDVGAILDERNGMRTRNFGKCVEIGERRAVVDRDDGLGAARDQALDGFG